VNLGRTTWRTTNVISLRTFPAIGLLLIPLSLIAFRGNGQEYNFDTSLVNRFNHTYEVELVPQTTEVSCWAAATAMSIGWRDMVVLNPQEIADGVGYWAQYNNQNYRVDRILDANDLNMFEAWNLVPDTRFSFSLNDIAELLWDFGPLWVASDETLLGDSTHYGHIRVICGIQGDGTPAGTLLFINDPWDRNRTRFHRPNNGSQYTETFEEFIRKMQHLQHREHNQDAIYLAYP